MALMTLGDALGMALSDKELIGEAVGAALGREKAAVEVGAKTAVSFTGQEVPTANGFYAARRIPTGPKASHAPARSVGIRLVVNNEMGGRRDGGGARSPADQRSPKEGKARRTVLKLVHSRAAP